MFSQGPSPDRKEPLNLPQLKNLLLIADLASISDDRITLNARGIAVGLAGCKASYLADYKEQARSEFIFDALESLAKAVNPTPGQVTIPLLAGLARELNYPTEWQQAFEASFRYYGLPEGRARWTGD